MDPDRLHEWDPEDERNRTGERLIARDRQDAVELAPETLPTEPPAPHDDDAAGGEPFGPPDSDALPTQPDLEAPPAPPRGIVESYIDELGADSDDLRDTIPAPVPPIEES